MTLTQYDFGRAADLSTGHLPLSVRQMLDGVELHKSSLLLAKTGFGYLMRSLQDQPAPADLPLEVVLLLDNATLQGFEMIHFDASGIRDPSFLWFEDGDVALEEEAGVPVARVLADFLVGLRSQEADPQKRVLFHMAALAVRRIEIGSHEPPKDLLIEIRDAAVELAYEGVAEDRFGQVIGSLQSWRPEPDHVLEF